MSDLELIKITERDSMLRRIAELVKRLSHVDEYEPLGHDGWEAARAIEALIGERDEAHARGYREGLDKAAKIADGEAHADCDVAEQIAKFIRALIPEDKP